MLEEDQQVGGPGLHQVEATKMAAVVIYYLRGEVGRGQWKGATRGTKTEGQLLTNQNLLGQPQKNVIKSLPLCRKACSLTPVCEENCSKDTLTDSRSVSKSSSSAPMMLMAFFELCAPTRPLCRKKWGGLMHSPTVLLGGGLDHQRFSVTERERCWEAIVTKGPHWKNSTTGAWLTTSCVPARSPEAWGWPAGGAVPKKTTSPARNGRRQLVTACAQGHSTASTLRFPTQNPAVSDSVCF